MAADQFSKYGRVRTTLTWPTRTGTARRNPYLEQFFSRSRSVVDQSGVLLHNDTRLHLLPQLGFARTLDDGSLEQPCRYHGAVLVHVKSSNELDAGHFL
jgi:hypothetical protein